MRLINGLKWIWLLLRGPKYIVGRKIHMHDAIRTIKASYLKHGRITTYFYVLNEIDGIAFSENLIHFYESQSSH